MSNKQSITICGDNDLLYLEATFRKVTQSDTMKYILSDKEDSTYLNLSRVLLKYLMLQMILIHHSLNFDSENVATLFEKLLKELVDKKITNHVLYEDTIEKIKNLGKEEPKSED